MTDKTTKPLKIFVVAGEASGDQLGARFLKDFYAGKEVEVSGVGGPSLMQAGSFTSLFEMEDLSVMGIAEVVPRIRLLLKRIKQTAKAIHEFKPDIVLTIDAPDFCFRVIKRYQKLYKGRGEEGAPLFHHLVAPTVWAWRPGRAKKVAAILDHLYCLFPFEPSYFEAEGLKATYVGHPFVPLYTDLATKRQNWRQAQGIDPNTKLIGIFPGSRNGEIKRMLPVLSQVAEKLHKKHEGLEFVILTLPHLKKKIEKKIKKKSFKARVIDDVSQKEYVIASLDAAMATSGTIGFELSLAKIPHIVAYKMNKLTSVIARMLVKTPYMHLTNIHLKRLAVPEFFQEACSVQEIEHVMTLLLQPTATEIGEQKQAFEMLGKLLDI